MAVKVVRGVQVPAIGLGTAKLRGEACRSLVEAALRMGYRHLDTAHYYGNEADIGHAIRSAGVNREKLFLTTKIWNDEHEPAAVVSTTEQSLLRLGTSYLDLLLIHWPGPRERMAETFAAMAQLQARGLVREIGASNFTPPLLRHALEVAPIFCNQIEYHPLLSQPTTLRLAAESELLIVAHTPIMGGRLASHARLEEIGRSLEASSIQVVLKWLVDQPNVVAIPGARSVVELAENIQAEDVILNEKLRCEINAMDEGVRVRNPSYAPEWCR